MAMTMTRPWRCSARLGSIQSERGRGAEGEREWGLGLAGGVAGGFLSSSPMTMAGTRRASAGDWGIGHGNADTGGGRRRLSN